MTTTPWPAPARSSADWHGKVSPCERACEDAIAFGSDDYSETDAALRILHALTGRCHVELAELVAELLDYAEDVHDAEHGSISRHSAAIDTYMAALSKLAMPLSFDAAVTAALRLPNGELAERVR